MAYFDCYSRVLESYDSCILNSDASHQSICSSYFLHSGFVCVCVGGGGRGL